MDNFSLSDLAAVTNNEGLGNSAWLVLLFLIIFGAGGNGFGFNRNNGYTDATTNEILSGQKFDALSRSINQVGDGLCSSTYSLNNSIQTEGRAIQTQLCAINSNIDNKFAALEKSQLEQRINEQAQQINQLYMQQAICGIPKISTTIPYNGCGCYNS